MHSTELVDDGGCKQLSGETQQDRTNTPHRDMQPVQTSWDYGWKPSRKAERDAYRHPGSNGYS